MGEICGALRNRWRVFHVFHIPSLPHTSRPIFLSRVHERNIYFVFDVLKWKKRGKKGKIESEMMLPLCLNIPIAHLLSAEEMKNKVSLCSVWKIEMKWNDIESDVVVVVFGVRGCFCKRWVVWNEDKIYYRHQHDAIFISLDFSTSLLWYQFLMNLKLTSVRWGQIPLIFQHFLRWKKILNKFII